MQWSSDQTRLSLASMDMDFSGLVLRGIQKLSLTDELSKDPIYANSSVSIGVPAGQHKGEGSLQVITEEADNIRNGLGDQFGTTPGTIGVSLFEPAGAGLITYNASRVYLIKLEVDFGEAGGSKPGLETFGLMILDPIDWNGVSIVRDQRAGALLLGSFSIGGLTISL